MYLAPYILRQETCRPKCVAQHEVLTPRSCPDRCLCSRRAQRAIVLCMPRPVQRVVLADREVVRSIESFWPPGRYHIVGCCSICHPRTEVLLRNRSIETTMLFPAHGRIRGVACRQGTGHSQRDRAMPFRGPRSRSYVLRRSSWY